MPIPPKTNSTPRGRTYQRGTGPRHHILTYPIQLSTYSVILPQSLSHPQNHLPTTPLPPTNMTIPNSARTWTSLTCPPQWTQPLPQALGLKIKEVVILRHTLSINRFIAVLVAVAFFDLFPANPWNYPLHLAIYPHHTGQHRLAGNNKTLMTTSSPRCLLFQFKLSFYGITKQARKYSSQTLIVLKNQSSQYTIYSFNFVLGYFYLFTIYSSVAKGVPILVLFCVFAFPLKSPFFILHLKRAHYL